MTKQELAAIIDAAKDRSNWGPELFQKVQLIYGDANPEYFRTFDRALRGAGIYNDFDCAYGEHFRPGSTKAVEAQGTLDAQQKQDQQQAEKEVSQEVGQEKFAEQGTAAIDELIETAQTERFKPVSTGLKNLDYCLGGGLFSQTIILLGAGPGMGKTALAGQIAESLAKAGRDVIFFNLEMSREQLMARSLARIAKGPEALSALDILQGYKWTPAQRAAVLDAAEEYRQTIAPHLIYNPAETNELGGIEMALEKAAKQLGHGPIVFLDYLQLVTHSTDGREDDAATAVKNTLKVLKRYAVNHDTSAVILTANNRASLKTGETDLYASRDTSNAEYSGDMLLGLDYAAIYNGTTLKEISETKEKYWNNPTDTANKLRFAQLCQRMTIRTNKNRFAPDGRRAYFIFDGGRGKFIATEPPGTTAKAASEEKSKSRKKDRDAGQRSLGDLMAENPFTNGTGAE